MSEMLAFIYKHLYRLYVIMKWYYLKLITSPYCESTGCLVGKTAIVTGGCMGIGYNLCLLLASRGCRVIIADIADAEKSRQEIIEKTENKNILTKYLDLASFESTRKFAADICKTESKIDILIHNAATPKPFITEDNLDAILQVGFIGSFLLTHLLVEPLKAASARVVFTGSIMAHLCEFSIENFEERLTEFNHTRHFMKSFRTYRLSKLLNILTAQEFARKLREHGVKVNCYDPGSAATHLTIGGFSFQEKRSWLTILESLRIIHLIVRLSGGSSFVAAQTGFHLASSVEMKDVTDVYFYRSTPFDKPLILKNGALCEKVWTFLENLVQLKPQEKL